MDTKKVAIISITSIFVVSILYIAIKQSQNANPINDPKVQQDYNNLLKKIDSAKK